MTWIETLLQPPNIIQALTLITLVVTATFILLYLKETQKMNYQMREQNRLTKKQIKSLNIPILDAIIEQVNPRPDLAHLKMEFAYDLFLVNRGSGAALNILIKRIPSIVRGQKEITHETARVQIDNFQKEINIIGKDQKVFIHREHSDSYREFTLKIMFSDIFRDHYEWEFEGDRDGLTLKTFEIFRSEDKTV